MTIQEILKNIPEISVVLKKNDTVFAEVSRDKFAEVSTMIVDEFDLPLSLLFATDDVLASQSFGVHAIFSSDKTGEWLKLSTKVPAIDPQFPSLTATIMAAHWYERYIQDMFGISAVGHPDPRRLVSHENIPQNFYPLRKEVSLSASPEKTNIPYSMHHVEGEGVFEIPVGPIHAGIIEPGHFRFNVVGERILTLEGKLFFTHKGVEKLLEGKTVEEGLPFIERLSGDMAASNALAYVQAIESISNAGVPRRAQYLRTLICELERLTMHIHDLANIGGMGTGYSFIAANGFRIKERMMRLSNAVCGNRFWRGMIVPGGFSENIEKGQLEKILKISQDACAEMLDIVHNALGSDGFLDRLQLTGVLPLEVAKAFGALGLPARASGLDRDTRRDHVYAAYDEFPVNIAVRKSGDVHSRYLLRIDEIKESLSLIEKLIKNVPDGEILTSFEIQDGFALGAVESWRGEILCALDVRGGVIERCFPRDPSFCNWALFGIIGPGNIVPDFPLCNKSLNLSYSGTDM